MKKSNRVLIEKDWFEQEARPKLERMLREFQGFSIQGQMKVLAIFDAVIPGIENREVKAWFIRLKGVFKRRISQ